MSENPPPAPTAAHDPDRFAARARPAFLYVIYIVILGGLPVAAIAAFDPARAAAICAALAAYFRALPEALYTLFGAAYLGYTAARQWGKVAGTDR
jgi:hypothetical protein